MVSTTPCSSSVGLSAALHLIDGAQELGQALEREELALQRHQHPVRGGQSELSVSRLSDGGQSIST